MQFFLLFMALMAGAITPLQATNAELHKHWQQPVWTTAWVYLSGLTGMLVVLAITRQHAPSSAAFAAAPWWSWMGGLISIVSTMIGLMYAQKLGSGMFTGLSITASILVSILLDHMGWIGFTKHPASPMRLVGGALMVAGIWLVSRF